MKPTADVPPGVDAVRRKTEEDSFLFLLNHNLELEEIRLPNPGRDLLTAKEHDSNLILAPKGAYGNLILFSTPDVPAEWYQDEIHSRAVKLSPGHYHQVRLHKGSVSGSMLGGCQITIERTKGGVAKFVNELVWMSRVLRYGREKIPPL